MALHMRNTAKIDETQREPTRVRQGWTLAHPSSSVRVKSVPNYIYLDVDGRLTCTRDPYPKLVMQRPALIGQSGTLSVRCLSLLFLLPHSRYRSQKVLEP